MNESSKNIKADTQEPDESTQTYASLRAFAKAIGRSHSVVLRWMNREDWTASVAKSGPWTDTDVAIVHEWMAETLQEDRTGHHSQADTADGFYRSFGDEKRRWNIPTGYADRPARDASKYPRDFASAFERDVVTGKRKLTKLEAQRLARAFFRFRALLVEMCEYLPAWLVRKDQEEITRRMRCAMYDKCLWAKDVIEGIDSEETWLDIDDGGNRTRYDRKGNVVEDEPDDE